MKKILLLGSQGNLGSQVKYVIESQLKKSFELIAWTRRDCDVTNFLELEKKFKEINPDVVINTIAYNNVDGCESDLSEQEKAIILNVRLVEYLATLCLNNKCQLVTFSSNYVFSGKKESYTEFDTPDPINFYGLTKKMGEDVVLEHIKRGLTASVIRVANLFGPAGLGKSSKPSFFDIIISVSENKDMIEVVDDELCCFTYTKDIALELPQFLLYPEKMAGIHHIINSGNAKSWYRATLELFRILNKTEIKVTPVRGEKFNRKALRPRSAVLEVTKECSPKLRSFSEALISYLILDKEQ